MPTASGITPNITLRSAGCPTPPTKTDGCCAPQAAAAAFSVGDTWEEIPILLSPGFVHRMPRRGFVLREANVALQGTGWLGSSHWTGAFLGSAVDFRAPGNPIQAKASAQAARKRVLMGLMMSILSRTDSCCNSPKTYCFSIIIAV